VHDGEVRLEHLRKPNGDLGPACVGRDRDHALAVQAEVAEVAREQLLRGHVVDGDREEALNLAGVQVHRQHPVDSRELEHVRHETRRDRLARLRLAVLARVREPRDHRCDPLRGRELRCLDHERQLHHVPVDRLASGLDQEDVGAADRLQVAAIGLAVGELLELDFTQLHPELSRDRLSQVVVRPAGEDHQTLEGASLDPVAHSR
jgi:hypothetical protein